MEGLGLLLWHVEVFQGWVRGYLMRSHARQRMSFRAKLTLMFTMLISQIGTHAFVAYEVVENLPRDANYAPMAVLHGLVFVYFLYRFGVVVHDVYPQNFIMTSIGRARACCEESPVLRGIGMPCCCGVGGG